MIKAILFVVFFIALAAFIALTVWMGFRVAREGNSTNISEELRSAKRKHDEKVRDIKWYGSGDNTEALQKENKRYAEEIEDIKSSVPHVRTSKPGLFAGIGLTVATLGLVICIPGSFHQVETGTVAVVKRLGVITGVRQPGTYYDFYMTNSYEVYDTKVQQDKIVTAAYSKDGQTMELEVFLQYQVQTEHIKEIATQYGNLDALQSRIETQTIEKTKAVMSSDIAMNIIQNRAQFSNDVSTAVREGISADYYVNIKDVVLTNIDFTDEFEKSVEDKVIAEQEKQAAITRAEAELEVAKLEAQRKIEEARGNAEAQKIIAKAAAEAATYNIIELARTLGYTITETYFYSVDGVETSYTTKQVETETCIYLGTQYVIDITSGPGAEKFKSLVEDYLMYLAYLEQWDGELPDVVAGDDALSIIVPSGN